MADLRTITSILLVMGTVSCLTNSNFIQTRVIIEPKWCSQKFKSYHFNSEIVPSRLRCVALCSRVEDCRRIMFDFETRNCTLYEAGDHCFIKQSQNTKIVCFRLKRVCGATNCSRCPIGYYGDHCQFIIGDCSAGVARGVVPLKTMMSFIQPSPSVPVVEVKCDFSKSRVSTLMLYRTSGCTKLDFNRSWSEYSVGFGYAHDNYWLGLENTYHILQFCPTCELTVFLDVFGQEKSFKHSYKLNISDSSNNYAISLGSVMETSSNTIDDPWTTPGFNISGRPFSTYDRDYTGTNGCPTLFNSGWWFLDDPVCGLANVNGRWTTEHLSKNMFWTHDGQRRFDIKKVILKITNKV